MMSMIFLLQVTRYYVLGSIAVTAGCVFDLISPFYLYFSWSAVIEKGEVCSFSSDFCFLFILFSGLEATHSVSFLWKSL